MISFGKCLQLYEGIKSDSSINHGISDHALDIFVLTRDGTYLQHVNWLAIPSTTHHGTKRYWRSSCVWQPGHTAPWKHRQKDIVSCVPEIVTIKPQKAKIVSRRVAWADVIVSILIQPSQAVAILYFDQTGSTVQFIHRPRNQTLRILLLPEDLYRQLTVGLGRDTGLRSKYIHTLPWAVHEHSTFLWPQAIPHTPSLVQSWYVAYQSVWLIPTVKIIQGKLGIFQGISNGKRIVSEAVSFSQVKYVSYATVKYILQSFKHTDTIQHAIRILTFSNVYSSNRLAMMWFLLPLVIW